MYKNLTEVSIYVMNGRATDESLDKLNLAIIKEAGGHQREDKGLFIPTTFPIERVIEMAKEIVEPESENPILFLEFYKGYNKPPKNVSFKELAETSINKTTDYALIKPISLYHKEATVYFNNPRMKGKIVIWNVLLVSKGVTKFWHS